MESKENVINWDNFEKKVIELFEMVYKLPKDLQQKAAQQIEATLAHCLQTISQSLKGDCNRSDTPVAITPGTPLLIQEPTIESGSEHENSVTTLLEQLSGAERKTYDAKEPVAQRKPWWWHYPRSQAHFIPGNKGYLGTGHKDEEDFHPFSPDNNQSISKDVLGESLSGGMLKIDCDKKPPRRKPKGPRGRPKLGKQHICKHCNKVFRRPCELREHESFVHEGKKRGPFANTQCEDCGRMFQTSGGLNFHRKRYHEVGREVHRCTECTYATFKKECMESHMIKFHGPNRKRNCVCDVCGKGFSKENQLKMHIEVHSEEKKYSCKDCTFSTHTVSGLRSHIYAQHNPNARTYHCETCNKRWKKRNLYKYHMEKHHKVKIQMIKKPGPRPVCGDDAVIEKAAVAIAAESMATLSSMPALEGAMVQPSSLDNIQNQMNMVTSSAGATLQSSSPPTDNIPSSISLTASQGQPACRQDFSTVPIPVFCFQSNALEPSTSVPMVTNIATQTLVQQPSLPQMEECRDQQALTTQDLNMGKADAIYQVASTHNQHVPALQTQGMYPPVNSMMTLSQNTNMATVLDNLLSQINPS